MPRRPPWILSVIGDALLGVAAYLASYFVVAESMFASMPFGTLARCIASVVRRLQPSGRLYASRFENPAPADFEPIVQASGVTTYSDQVPFHYPLAVVVNVCDAIGATVRRATAPNRAESLLVISCDQERSA